MQPIPITLLSGWLGSGKTTLLNRVLAEAGGRRIAVLQNEFGDIGLDGTLIEGNIAALYELSGGCICCTVHDDFMAAIEEIVTLDPPPDSIIVETTGVADPSVPLISILQHPEYGDAFELDGVVTMVDAENFLEVLDESPEVSLQVGAADLLLMSRCDRVDRTTMNRVAGALSEINPEGQVVRCDRGDYAPLNPLDLGGFDPSRLSIRSSGITGAARDHSHSTDIRPVCFGVDAAMDFDRLEPALGEIFDRWGEGILRAKGILRISGVDPPMLLQGVRRRYSWQYAPGPPVESSRLVLIGRDLDAEEITALLRRAVVPAAEAT